ncbi:MAG: organic solvent tolerance protein OstA [Beijerinckiaceae bacterium]|nr:organic solvent tolerance protein OstA [Beijerinckiaceae bacterium]
MMRFVLASAIALSFAGTAVAQQAKSAQGQRATTGVLGIGASKAPISIDADKLQVYDKEQRAVYTGNVVVVQGETTMKAAHMTVFYERNNQEAQATENAGGGPGGAQLKRVEAKGDVVITSKDQVAKGDNGVLDRENDRMILTGNVSLSQGDNITKGERLFYNLSSGIATVEGGRVRSLLIPGSDEPGKQGATGAKPTQPTPPSSQQKPKP